MPSTSCATALTATTDDPLQSQLVAVQGSSEGSELTLYGEAQAARCRKALSQMQLDRYSQPGCVRLIALLVGFQASNAACLLHIASYTAPCLVYIHS